MRTRRCRSTGWWTSSGPRTRRRLPRRRWAARLSSATPSTKNDSRGMATGTCSGSTVRVSTPRGSRHSSPRGGTSWLPASRIRPRSRSRTPSHSGGAAAGRRRLRAVRAVGDRPPGDAARVCSRSASKPISRWHATRTSSPSSRRSSGTPAARAPARTAHARPLPLGEAGERRWRSTTTGGGCWSTNSASSRARSSSRLERAILEPMPRSRPAAEPRRFQRDRHLPVHGHRGLDQAAPSAGPRPLRGDARRARAAVTRCLRRPQGAGGGHAGRFVLRRLPHGCRRRRGGRRRSARPGGRTWPEAVPSECAWACTRVSRGWARNVTSGSASTGRRVSARPATAARCCSLPRRGS